MNLPGVSFVMAIHKPNKLFLKKCIESILKQTYQGDIEIVVVDDTHDPSNIWNSYISEIIKRSDSKVLYKYVQNSKKKGLASALNLGIKNSSFDFIARIDDDDFCSLNRIKVQVDFLMKDPTIGVLGSDCFLINENDQLIGESKYPSKHSEILELLPLKNPFCHPAVIFRKEIAIKAGLYNEDYLYSQDYEFWGRMLLLTKGANISEKLVYRRIHNQSISSKTNTRRIQIKYTVKAIDSILKRHKVGYLILIKARLLQKYSIFLLLLPSKVFEFIRKAKKAFKKGGRY